MEADSRVVKKDSRFVILIRNIRIWGFFSDFSRGV